MSTDDKKKSREADELARTGQQYMKQKPADYTQAIECYTQAISLNPLAFKNMHSGMWLIGANGTGGVIDVSGNGFHGTVSGALPTSDYLPSVRVA